VITGTNPCLPNPCQNNGLCTPSGTSYVCACLTGYTGQRCETRKNLLSVFECLVYVILIYSGDPCAQNPCLNGGQCMANNVGGFLCLCMQPYTGPRCEDRKFLTVDYISLYML